jgi:hypothetical protein
MEKIYKGQFWSTTHKYFGLFSKEKGHITLYYRLYDDTNSNSTVALEFKRSIFYNIGKEYKTVQYYHPFSLDLIVLFDSPKGSMNMKIQSITENKIVGTYTIISYGKNYDEGKFSLSAN